MYKFIAIVAALVGLYYGYDTIRVFQADDTSTVSLLLRAGLCVALLSISVDWIKRDKAAGEKLRQEATADDVHSAPGKE